MIIVQSNMFGPDVYLGAVKQKLCDMALGEGFVIGDYFFTFVQPG